MRFFFEIGVKAFQEKPAFFLPGLSEKEARELAKSTFLDTLALRHRLLDDKLVDTIQYVRETTKLDPVVVSIGCGLETRVYRLPLGPGVDYFELDSAEMIEYKTLLLEKAERGVKKGRGGVYHFVADQQDRTLCADDLTLKCHRRTFVSCDFERGQTAVEQLRQAGCFERGRPIIYVVEGVLFYLTSREVHSLLQELATASPSGSHILCDMANSVRALFFVS